MKLYVTSDIHLEFGDCVIENKDNVDVLILGGDIMLAHILHEFPENNAQLPTTSSSPTRQHKAQEFRNFLKKCSLEFPHVIYVAGNHEFYHSSWPKGLQHLRDECAKFHNVYFMENDSRTIDDYTFIGCTLWTDMNKGDPLTLHTVEGILNDFRIIRNSDLKYMPLRPRHVAAAHRDSVEYIRTMIEGNVDQKFVVAGHMLPSKQSTHPKYKKDTLINGAFSSDLDDFILGHPQIKLWTHGHTHEDFDYMIGSTRIVCNPRGYVNHEERTTSWQPKLVEI
jgi:predicted phosphodiesterase